ncbi:hypothetical protein [Amycolatopsis sp. cmx-4-83]|uniref:hypothetical protein n=1 Tax=Amycolatopsis sp. cmx-4-83 TaxID=2790940 RepID=UPI00397AA0D2
MKLHSVLVNAGRWSVVQLHVQFRQFACLGADAGAGAGYREREAGPSGWCQELFGQYRRRRCERAYSVRGQFNEKPSRNQDVDHPVDFRRPGAADYPRGSRERFRYGPEGRIVTGALPRQRGTETSEDEFARLGLGGSLALTGLLAAVKIAETATGVVLTATGVLPGANTPKEKAPAWPGGE